MMWMRVALAALLFVGFGCRDDESAETAATQQAVKWDPSATDECDLKPIDDRGTLPACAAGKTTERGPGRAYDSLDDASPHELSLPELSSQAETERRRIEANSASLIDCGFAPILDLVQTPDVQPAVVTP